MPQMMRSIVEQAEVLRDFVDTLIPGDDGWPAAGLVGVQAVLALRLLEREGDDAVQALVESLLSRGAPFAGRSVGDREAIVARFEADAPQRFAFIRDAVTFAYYDNPLVIAAIKSMGQPYKAIPVYEGYRLPAFDRETDTPRHGRGSYIPTDAVRRVDVSGLAHLQPPKPTGM